MKTVILTDDKNNTVHYFDFGTRYCNHVPLEEDDYEVVDGEEVNCEGCIEMNKVYDNMSEQLREDIDNDILRMYLEFYE